MTAQTVALLVHAIMESPDFFTEKNEGIHNGYYHVKFNGSKYGMGISSYVADGTEQDMLLRAIRYWKQETGWKPKEADPIPEPVSSTNMQRKDLLKAHEEFAHAVRSNLKSYIVHDNATVLYDGIRKAAEALDAVVHSIEKIEGK